MRILIAPDKFEGSLTAGLAAAIDLEWSEAMQGAIFDRACLADGEEAREAVCRIRRARGKNRDGIFPRCVPIGDPAIGLAENLACGAQSLHAAASRTAHSFSL